MSLIDQSFQTFLTRIRPHRVAIFANSADPHWDHNCIGIIEFLTKLWGGSRCVIIPTDGQTISEEFWSILSSHDPDIFLRYQPTGADLKSRAPEEFDHVVLREVTDYSNEHGLDWGQDRELIEGAILKAPIEEWNMSDELKATLLRRLAPFHFAKQPLHDLPSAQLNVFAIAKGEEPGYPLTSIMDVIRAGHRPSRITQLGITDLLGSETSPPKLWLAATIGCGDQGYFHDLLSEQVTPVWTTADERLSLNTLIKSAIRPWRHTTDQFPFGLTTAGLTSVRAGGASRFAVPTIVVVGSSLKDFCLYFNLYWQQGRALWLPPWFMPNDGEYPDHLLTAVHEALDAARPDHNEQLVLVSYSMPHTELLRLKETLHGRLLGSKIEVRPISSEMVVHQMKSPSRVYTDGNLGNITTHMLLNSSLPGWFESPVPRTLHPASPLSHRWIVDIVFIKHLLPRHPALGRIAITGANVGDVRAGIDCVSYTCPGIAVFGDHMETNLLRPSIHIPDVEEIFRVVLEDCGYLSQTSDKGRYETATLQKFGGLESLGEVLWSPKPRALLMQYLDGSVATKGVFDQGVFLKNDRRRYLDFQSISRALGDERKARESIDEYIGKGILYRGFIFSCASCSAAAWHSIADVDQNFVCIRCGLRQQYKVQSWKHPNEPSWFYKLDEMVYLMLKNNGHVPLLTLNKLRIRARDSFLFRPELRLTKMGTTATYLEVDVCCVIDGKLCVGEAKSTDSLQGDQFTSKETAERYCDLAVAMGASMVVFSTSMPTWDDTSMNAISEVFTKHPYIEVHQWTSNELYI